MSHFEFQQLAGVVLGLTDKQIDDIIDNDEDFDTPLLEKFAIDFDQFTLIAEELLKLTPVLTSPLSGVVDHAFVKQTKSGYLAIIKMPVKSLLVSN